MMQKGCLLSKVILGVLAFLIMSTVQAGTPVWTLTPDAGFPPTITIAQNDTATIKYTVTNQSHKPHTLQMEPIQGITPSGCTSTLGDHQSCTLTLSVNGSALEGDVIGGPVLCEESNPFQCYQPSSANSLHITVGSAAYYTVGGTVSGLSGTVVLQDNGGDDLTINSDGSFTFATAVAEGATYNVTVLTQPATQTCTVTNGSGTISGANVTNVSVNCVTNTTTLSASVSNLALSVTGFTEFGVTGTPSSGHPRTITITNTGSNTAVNLAVTPPTWPLGTSSSTCGSSLAAGDTCTITVTPGATATSDGTNPCSVGTAPVPGAVQVSADNATTVSTNVVVLSYGCVYQGGYVYAFDDTTPSSGSVGGKVVTTSDQSSGIVWSSNGNGGGIPDAVYNAIYGISELSTTSSANPSGGQVAGQTACNGATDGLCNTNNIYVYYQNNATNAPINLSYYATGLCKQTIASYSDWYLPAICEMGYGTTECGTSGAPTLQNIQTSLYEICNFSTGTTTYWSSTEYSSIPQFVAWYYLFEDDGSGAPGNGVAKANQWSVKCSRALTL